MDYNVLKFDFVFSVALSIDLWKYRSKKSPMHKTNVHAIIAHLHETMSVRFRVLEVTQTVFNNIYRPDKALMGRLFADFSICFAITLLYIHNLVGQTTPFNAGEIFVK